MNDPFQAIYEHGVLRPLEPVDLKEAEVVSLALVRSDEPETDTASADQQRALRQRDVLLAFVTKVEAYPDDSPRDGFSNRDHDRLIYGS